MRKMVIDLFFPDSHRLGEFPGTHFLVTQEDHHLLTDRLHIIPLFFNPIVYHPAIAGVSNAKVSLYSRLIRLTPLRKG